MNGYVNELLEEYDLIAGVASTPAGNNLFAVSDSSPTLLNVEKDEFHSLTAKLLYLSKRVRPDILTAISFLSKRVLTPTEQDKKKLERVLKYIRGTKDKGIVLEAGKCLSILAYIDSSYGVHMDMRSHTGCVIGLGLGPIYAKSSGQKINTKSSTEAELVGLSDSTGQVVWTRNFLLEQGYDVGPATIYQDNMSTIIMATKGGSFKRTKHLLCKHSYVRERIANKEIVLKHLPTKKMVADMLTKPVSFKQLNKFLNISNIQ
jgi:histone deacetylase 1/2